MTDSDVLKAEAASMTTEELIERFNEREWDYPRKVLAEEMAARLDAYTGSTLIGALLELDGVEKVNAEGTLTVTHKKRNTGELTDNYQEIREPVVDEETFEGLAERYDWNYLGTIDAMSDFHLRDRFTKQETLENDE